MSQEPTPTASGRRAAATWVTATGVMLLLAAATLFVAVRWDQIPDGAKLAALGLVTIGALLGGRAMTRTLPATGDVVFHLGALLIPLDLAAALTRAGTAWPAFVLAEGVVSALVFAALAVATGSVTLRSAAWVSVPVAAAGVAACTPVPAAAVLAAFALAAFVVTAGPRPNHHVHRAAVAWAALAAIGPVLGAAGALLAGADGFRIGLGTLTALGLAGHAFAWAALPTGVASAVVLGVEADRRHDLRLAFATFVAVAVGAGTALTGSDLAPGIGLVAVAGAFATLELAALALATDSFWGAPLRRCAIVGEIVAAVPSASAGYAVFLAPFLPDGPWPWTRAFTPDRSLAAALALVALGWLTADVRGVRAPIRRARLVSDRYGTPLGAERVSDPVREPQPLLRSLARGSGRAGFTMLVAVPLTVAVLVGTGSSRAVAVALLALSAAAVAGRRGGGRPLAAVALPFAVVCAGAVPVAAIALAVSGAAALALSVRPDDHDVPAWLIASSAVSTLLIGSAFAASAVVDSSAAIALATAGALVALWLLALTLDARRAGTGDVARIAGLLPLLGAVVALGPAAMIGPVAIATALATIDAVRGARPRMLIAPALLVQLLIYDVAVAIGLSSAEAGLALCTAAGVWAGVAAVVRLEWREGATIAAVVGLVVGLDLASAEPSTLATAVMIAGLLVVSAGLLARKAPIAHLGAAIATAGLFGHLSIAGVDGAEWYLTPLTAQALVAGWQLRRRDGVSSWVAYAPAIVLLGGAAFVERVAGGSAGHALFCGAVGVAAVAIGGWRRLSAPLVVGTGLLVAVSVHESLSSLAGVATWMWFAAGGVALVAAGVALERTDRGPVEAGRRLAEVLGERFG